MPGLRRRWAGQLGRPAPTAAHAAVVRPRLHPVADDARQVAHHRLLGDHDPARETGAPRGVLEIGELVGAGRNEPACGLREFTELLRGPDEAQREALGRFAQKRQEKLRRHGHLGAAVEKQPAELGDVGLVPAEVDGGRQRDRHHPRILAGIEETQEIRTGFGHEGDPRAALQTEPREAGGDIHGLVAQLRVRQNRFQMSPSIIEVGSGLSSRGVIQRFGQGRKVAGSQRQVVFGRCRLHNGRLSFSGSRLDSQSVFRISAASAAGKAHGAPRIQAITPPPGLP